MIDHTIGVVA